MIVEYIGYALTSHSGDALVEAYRQASEQLAASENALAWELTRCAEDPVQFILRIEWDSADGHMKGFRRGPEFPAFLQAIRPFVGEIAERRRYELTDVVSG